MALCATSSYYDINEVATRVLPSVVVLTIDPDRLYLFRWFDISSFSKKNVYRCVMNEVALSCEQWCQIKGISSSGSIFADCKAIPWKGVNACPFFLIAFFLCFSCDVWLPDYLIFCYTDIFYDFIVDKYRRCHWSFKCWNLVNARECQFTWVSDRNFHYGEVRLFCVLLFVGMIVYLASTLFWTMIWKMVDLEDFFFLLQENLKSGCYMLSVCQGVPLGSFDMFFILEFCIDSVIITMQMGHELLDTQR